MESHQKMTAEKQTQQKFTIKIKTASKCCNLETGEMGACTPKNTGIPYFWVLPLAKNQYRLHMCLEIQKSTLGSRHHIPSPSKIASILI
jgi:hypothetical protein